MPINRVDPSAAQISAAEFRAAGRAEREIAMAEYLQRQAAVDARTAELRRQRLAAEMRKLRHAEAEAGRKTTKPRKRLRAEECRPDLFMAGEPVKRRVGI